MTAETPRTDAEEILYGIVIQSLSELSERLVRARFARQLETELSESRAQCEAMRANDARYRWLREHRNQYCIESRIPYDADDDLRIHWWGDLRKDCMDDLIDAAIDAELRGKAND